MSESEKTRIKINDKELKNEVFKILDYKKYKSKDELRSKLNDIELEYKELLEFEFVNIFNEYSAKNNIQEENK